MTFLGLPFFRAAQIVAQTGLDVSGIDSLLSFDHFVDCEEGYHY